MGTTQQFCLKWNNYSSNLVAVFESFMLNESFSDVTLACEGLCLKAHKVILSACSPFFQNLFTNHPCKHPVIILNNINYSDLKACIEFMYKGEVNVAQSSLSTLLKTAETLKVKGLAEVSSDLANNPNIQTVSGDANKTPQPKSVTETSQKRINHEIPPLPLPLLDHPLPLTTTLDEVGPSVVSESVVSGVQSDPKKSPSSNKSRKRKKPRHIDLSKKLDNRDSERDEGQDEISDEDDFNRTEDSTTQGSDDSNLAQSLTPALTMGNLEDVKPTMMVSYQEPSSCVSPNDTSSQSHLSQDDSNSPYFDSSLSISAGPSNFSQENRQLLPPGSSQDMLYKRNEQGLYQCPLCISTSSSAGNLTRHIRRQHGGNKFFCKICNREFTRSDNMKIHMRIHERPSTNYKVVLTSFKDKVEPRRRAGLLPKSNIESAGMTLRRLSSNHR